MTSAVPLVNLLIAKNAGDPTLFDKIPLQQGVEYTGEVVTPAGRPVAGASVELLRWGDDTNPSPPFGDHANGATGPDGRFRMRLPKAHQMAILVATADYARFQHAWGDDDADEHPDLWVPLDLGRLVLEDGIRLTGRLVDIEGRPIAGQAITATALYARFARTATTDADGRFMLAPLRQGNYVVHGAGQKPREGLDADEPPVTKLGTVFKPVKVYVKDGAVPTPLVLREVPTVAVETQFVDSQDRPTRGCVAALFGSFPDVAGQPAQQEAVFDGSGLMALINLPEREDKSPQLQWGEQLVPDALGRVVFRRAQGPRASAASNAATGRDAGHQAPPQQRQAP